MISGNKHSRTPTPSDAVVDSATVASRAGGRPPEEDSSADPESQARTILEDSEERIAQGVRSSNPLD